MKAIISMDQVRIGSRVQVTEKYNDGDERSVTFTVEYIEGASFGNSRFNVNTAYRDIQSVEIVMIGESMSDFNLGFGATVIVPENSGEGKTVDTAYFQVVDTQDSKMASFYSQSGNAASWDDFFRNGDPVRLVRGGLTL